MAYTKKDLDRKIKRLRALIALTLILIAGEAVFMIWSIIFGATAEIARTQATSAGVMIVFTVLVLAFVRNELQYTILDRKELTISTTPTSN